MNFGEAAAINVVLAYCVSLRDPDTGELCSASDAVTAATYLADKASQLVPGALTGGDIRERWPRQE